RQLLLDLVVLGRLIEVFLDDLEVVPLRSRRRLCALEELGHIVVATGGPEHDDQALRLRRGRADVRDRGKDRRRREDDDADAPRFPPHPVLLSSPTKLPVWVTAGATLSQSKGACKRLQKTTATGRPMQRRALRTQLPRNSRRHRRRRSPWSARPCRS